MRHLWAEKQVLLWSVILIRIPALLSQAHQVTSLVCECSVTKHELTQNENGDSVENSSDVSEQPHDHSQLVTANNKTPMR